MTTRPRVRPPAPIALALLLLASLSATAQPISPGQPPTARRILFLGDSITYSGQYVEFFETWLRLQFPGWQGEILNLGLPSETVSGLSEAGHAGGQFPRPNLHERLARVLERTRPDLVIACYGMNDGIYQPFDPARFLAFQAGIRRLRKSVEDTGARIIHLTPPTYDPVGAGTAATGFNYNDVLDRYSDWLLEQRPTGWTVIDIHGPMNRFLAAKRRTDPSYKLAGDGVHPGETGQWLIARPLLAHFGAPPEWVEAESPDPWLKRQSAGPEVLRCVQQRQRWLKDAWLTETRHQRPGMNRGLPLAEAQAKAAELQTRINQLLAPASSR